MNRISLFYFMCIILLIGCNKSETQNKCIIETQATPIHTNSIKLSDLFQVKNIVPLETTDKSLIGKIDKLLKTNNRFFIQSSGTRILSFDNKGKYLNDIGCLGSGPQEYPVLYDFDADNQYVYILTKGRILVYKYQANLVKEIPISVNATALKIIDDGFLLYTLGDKYVFHLINSEGKLIDKYMNKNQALRLTKAIPFRNYKNSYLSTLGRSNEVMVYDIQEQTFSTVNLTNLPDALTLKKENEVKESSGMKSNKLKSQGVIFDGMNATKDQLMFGSIDGEKIILWAKTTKEENGYLLSKIKDDITYLGIQYWLRENTTSSESFITFISPDYISESMKEHSSQFMESNYQSLKVLIDTIQTKEANPIIFEFNLK